MTPAKFKSIRRALGLSAQRLALLFRVSNGRTVRRWEAPDDRQQRDIPGPVGVLMALLHRRKITVRDLEDIEEL